MVSSNAALANLGSSFLERLGNQSNGINRLQRTNPGGGGASESTETPRYRTWFEGYGNHTRNSNLRNYSCSKWLYRISNILHCTCKS